MNVLTKAYRFDENKNKIYTAVKADTSFTIPKTANCYIEYIDSLYEASKELSPIEVVRGADVVTEAMICDIVNSENTIKAKGKTYYISNNGSDDNDGLSEKTAWATIEKLNDNYDSLKEGDAVLFERGGEWRKPSEWKTAQKTNTNWSQMCFLTAKKGVSYGAYGKGNKPIFNGSERNYADATLWKETGIENVYVCTELFWNAGVVAIDHTGKLGKYNEKMAMKEMIGLRGFGGVADMRIDCSYYHDMSTRKLYFCSTIGNPGERFKSIEIGGRLSLIDCQGGSYIENLHFKFDGYGVSGSPSLTIKNCIFSYLGGCMAGDKNGVLNLCGNAVEIYGKCNDFNVESCWIYQMCDTGVSHQLWSDKGECVQKNISFKGNVIEYCHWGIEFNNPPSSDGSKRLVENCEHSYNVIRNGGQGWADIQFGRQAAATLYNCFGTAKCVNTVCKKNILNQSTGLLYRMRLEGDPEIKYFDNINIQHESGLFAYLYDGDYKYDETAEERLKNSADVYNGTYIYLE